jgi:hypothetical protein
MILPTQRYCRGADRKSLGSQGEGIDITMLCKKQHSNGDVSDRALPYALKSLISSGGLMRHTDT